MKTHQIAFNGIKALIVGCDYLMTINHETPNMNKIFVTCDVNKRRTGAVLSFRKIWETAWPVAFDSQQSIPAEKNYPTYEHELLVIVCTLYKWHSDLLGLTFSIYMDHKMLKNFDTQKKLSKRQAR